MAFHCHQCNRRVAVDENFECSECHGGFVEEIADAPQVSPPPEEDADERAHAAFTGLFGGAAGPSPLASILSQLLTQRNPTHEPGAATTSDGSSPNAQDQNNPMDDNPLMSFLNQLLANLNADGARIHVQFGEAGPGHVFQPMHGSWGDYAWGDSGFDQIVTQLLNQFEGQTAQTVRPEDLQRIPMAEVTDEQVSNGAQCTTCMEAFQAKEQVAKLDCNHIFHRPCLEPWLRRNNTCPICRQAVDPSKWPPAPKQPMVSDIDELD